MIDVTKYNLHFSESFRNATDAERDSVCNGCGAKGGLKVPSTFYGLKIEEACQVHDWDYAQGKTKEDKSRADRYFLFNMLIIIEAQTGLINSALKPLRRRRALKYYEAVVTWGNSAFWEGK